VLFFLLSVLREYKNQVFTVLLKIKTRFCVLFANGKIKLMKKKAFFITVCIALHDFVFPFEWNGGGGRRNVLPGEIFFLTCMYSV
jgi:hypothetical protein